jgi:threonine dehydratase
VFDRVERCYQRIRKDIKRTRLEFNVLLSQETKAEVFLKTENTQISGSFKYRGVMSKLSLLKQEGFKAGKVVVSSTGNHAAALAWASRGSDIQPLVFVPETISAAKLSNLEKYDLEIFKQGKSSADTELLAAAYAELHGLTFIHPYNDPEVIAGQGTVAVELLEQLPDLDAVLVPVGGGGLISGIALYLKTIRPAITVIGCQPENAPEMVESVREGKIVEPSLKTTIADGTAGGLDPDTITFELCRRYVNDYVLLSEDEIRYAVYKTFKCANHVIEPAAALSVAALLKMRSEFKGKKTVSILSGDKINRGLFEQIIKDYDTNN